MGLINSGIFDYVFEFGCVWYLLYLGLCCYFFVISVVLIMLVSLVTLLILFSLVVLVIWLVWLCW